MWSVRGGSGWVSDWTCAQSGCCCQAAGAVGMTVGEWAVVKAEAPDVPVIVVRMPDGRVEVSAVDGSKACPFYRDGCTVYPVRPGVCRAYGCFRGAGVPYSETGHFQRIRESSGVRRVQARLLEAAERWTAACGST